MNEELFRFAQLGALPSGSPAGAATLLHRMVRITFCAGLALGLACAATTPGPRRSPPTPPAAAPGTLEPDWGADGTSATGREPHPAADPASRIAQVELRSPTDPTVSIQLRFATGSVDDPPGLEGLTLLTAALMAGGGAGPLDAAALRRALYPMAAELSVVSDKETVTFAGRCPASALERFLPVLLDVVLRPRIDAAGLDQLRARALEVVVRTLRAEDDERLAQEVLEAALFEGHPYGHPDEGTVEGLGRITLGDVQHHRQQVFVASRLTVGVAGGAPEGLALRIARKLASLPEGAPRVALPPPPERAPRFTLVEKASAPTAISMGFAWELSRGHPDFPALVVAVAALGQHRQGAAFRLFRSLREARGLNHGGYAYPERFVEEPGSALPEPGHPRSRQTFTVWIRPVEPQHRTFALRLALFEVDRWARDGLHEEELSRVKRFLAGHTLLYEATSARRLGNALDDRFYRLPGPWLPELRARIASLTLDEVNAALRRHVDPSRLRVVVATRGASALAEELRREAPSPMAYAAKKPEAVVAEDAEVARFPLGLRGAGDVRVVKVDELFQK